MKNKKLENKILKNFDISLIDGREIEIETSYLLCLQYYRENYERDFENKNCINVMNKYARYKVNKIKNGEVK